MTSYQYDFSEFLNDTADAQKLQNQIDASSISIKCDGVTISYKDEEVTIDFASDLSGGEITTLDGIVAAHDGIPYVDQGTGWVESSGVSGTSSSTWQEKIKLDYNSTADNNNFKIDWYAEVASSDSKEPWNNYRVIVYDNIDSTSIVIMDMERAFYKNESEGYWESMCGFKNLSLVGVGDYSITFEFRNTGGKTTYIRNARISVEEK